MSGGVRSDRAERSAAIEKAVQKKIEELTIAQRKYVMQPEPRCRVCQHEEVLAKVNRLLASGRSYKAIEREIQPMLDTLEIDENRRPTYSSIWTHAKRHFQLDQGARALYREVLERRALENDVDFIGGVSHAVTPLAMLETAMLKGYESMIENGVDVKTGLNAAVKLHELTTSSEEPVEVAQLISQLNQIIEAVRAVVPPEYHDKILARLNRDNPTSAPLDVEVVPEQESADDEDSDPAYDPDAEAIDQEDPDTDDD